jgi:2-(3-amino-3-carboxypropyl)histidine synthase
LGNNLCAQEIYDLEEAKVRSFLKRCRAKRAAIQLPAGLRQYLLEIKQTFDSAGVEALVLADSCYGACDTADVRAKLLGCDVLVHYGHSDMRIPTCLPTLYVEASMLVDLMETAEQALPHMKFNRVGLLTNVQHVKYLKKVAKLLRSRGFRPFIGGPGSRAKYPGQLLGCDFGCARSVASRVDGFLYLGTGDFHPLGAALATGKQILAVNPFSGRFKLICPDIDAFLRNRRAVIARAAAGARFGIIVSTKPGQTRLNLASELVESFKRAGRDAHLVLVDEVKPEELGDFRFDAFVCTACPRIPIDDIERFERPVLTPFEARVMLGKAKFEPYKMDEVSGEDLSLS